MIFSKRLFDLVLLGATSPITVPLFLCICLVVLIKERQPIFYIAERSGQNGTPFSLYKFRTMYDAPDIENTGVSGGDKVFRISKLGAVLRKTRLDELPQLLNILKGDMTFVGPRPPDPYYVNQHPNVYEEVLKNRPGLTGLATLYMHTYEARVLGQCKTRKETDSVYRTLCIPRKARLDLLYQKRQKRPGRICFDIWILLKSLAAIL